MLQQWDWLGMALMCLALTVAAAEDDDEEAEVLAASLVTLGGCYGGNWSSLSAQSLASEGKPVVVSVAVALGDHARVPCLAVDQLESLGLYGAADVADEVCWAHRPSLRRALALGDAAPTLGRYQVDSESWALLVSGVQADDEGTYDCFVRPAAFPGRLFASRVRLLIYDCAGYDPCASGVCGIRALWNRSDVAQAAEATCNCSAQAIFTGPFCDQKKVNSETMVILTPMLPYMIAIGLLFLIVFVSKLTHSAKPKIGLGLMRGKNRRLAEEKEAKKTEKMSNGLKTPANMSKECKGKSTERTQDPTFVSITVPKKKGK